MPTGYQREDNLIAEDLMLLLLDDRKGTTINPHVAPYLLAGALLCELTLLERLVQKEGEGYSRRRTLHVLGQGPLLHPLLLRAYDAVAPGPSDAQRVLTSVSYGLEPDVLDRLVNRNLVWPVEKKLLGLFLWDKRYPSTDTSRQRALRREMRDVLAYERTARPRVATLIALLSAGGSIKRVLTDADAHWTPMMKWRAKDFQRGNWGATEVSAAVAGSVATISVDAGSAVHGGDAGGGDGGDSGGGGDGGG